MKITVFLYSLVFLCAGMCCPPEDDTPYVSFEFDTPGLIAVEGETNRFSQNDTLWVNLVIPNTLLNENEEEIDIYELTGNTGIARLNLNLYLANNFDRPSPIILSENEIISTTGEVEYKYNLSVTARLVNGLLQSRFGIVLKEKGNYFLGSGYLPNPPSIYLESDNYNSVYIKTSFAGQNGNSFRFEVE